MTNKEYFKEQILEITCIGDVVAVDEKGNPYCCHGTRRCNDCIFSKEQDSCKDLRKKWFNAEYVEHCPFEKDELVEVSDDGIDWKLRYFSSIKNGICWAYIRGETSKENGGATWWRYCQKYGTLGGLVKGADNGNNE